MKHEVYSPNGTKLKIRSKKLLECPLCNELSRMESISTDDGEIRCVCDNCLLEYTIFSVEQFIKIRGFRKVGNYEM